MLQTSGVVWMRESLDKINFIQRKPCDFIRAHSKRQIEGEREWERERWSNNKYLVLKNAKSIKVLTICVFLSHCHISCWLRRYVRSHIKGKARPPIHERYKHWMVHLYYIVNTHTHTHTHDSLHHQQQIDESTGSILKRFLSKNEKPNSRVRFVERENEDGWKRIVWRLCFFPSSFLSFYY